MNIHVEFIPIIALVISYLFLYICNGFSFKGPNSDFARALYFIVALISVINIIIYSVLFAIFLYKNINIIY